MVIGMCRYSSLSVSYLVCLPHAHRPVMTPLAVITATALGVLAARIVVDLADQQRLAPAPFDCI